MKKIVAVLTMFVGYFGVAQVSTLTNPAEGDQIFSIADQTYYIYLDGVWVDALSDGATTNLAAFDQLLTANRNIELNGFDLDIKNGETEVVKFDTSEIQFGPEVVGRIKYFNQNSGLAASTVQEAIDELAQSPISTDDQTALEVPYDNASSGLTALNVKAAIDELAASGGSGSGISSVNQNRINNENHFGFRSLTASETPSSDAIEENTSGSEGLKVVNYNDAADTKVITLDGSQGAGKTLIYDVTNSNAVIEIKPDANSKLIIAGEDEGSANNAVRLDQLGQRAVVLQYDFVPSEFSSFSNVYHVSGSFTAYEEASCVADPNEYHTEADPASDPNCNEDNSLASYWNTISGNGTLSVENTEVDSGSYSVASTAGGGQVTYFDLSIPGTETSGDNFTITFRAKKTAGASSRLSQWQNCTGGPSGVDLTTNWETYTYNITATGNLVRLRFFTSANPSAQNGDKIFIDNLSIIKTN